MPLHLLKLCVGAESIADLEGWIMARLGLQRVQNLPAEQKHTTRMVPKRAAELLNGGSLYWVIKGQIAARQRLLEIRPFIGPDGIGRCDLVLEPVIVALVPRPCRPFQGWRYLAETDAPADLETAGAGAVQMPEELRRELRAMGLI